MLNVCGQLGKVLLEAPEQLKGMSCFMLVLEECAFVTKIGVGIILVTRSVSCGLLVAEDEQAGHTLARRRLDLYA